MIVCSMCVHREEHGSVAKSLGVEKVIVGNMHDQVALHLRSFQELTG